ncbi:hypothetical protein [Engelhardtia mirabilis]
MEGNELADLQNRLTADAIPVTTYVLPEHLEFARSWWPADSIRTTGSGTGMGMGMVEWRWDGRFVGLRLTLSTSAPDLLVYFVPPAGTGDEPRGGAELLADDAVLLGSFDGVEAQFFELPALPVMDGSRAVLYSLAHGRIVSSWSFGGMATVESRGD